MKITVLLERQHREVETLFSRIESAGGRERGSLVRELASRLAAHMRIEEELVYPLARAASPELAEEVRRSLDEHTAAAFALERAAEVGLDHETIAAKMKTLKDLVEHRVQAQERSLFPKMERTIDSIRLEQVGARALARFEEIVESGHGAALFDR